MTKWSIVMALPHIALFGLVGFLAACSPPPVLDAGRRIPQSDEVIRLLPLDELLAQTNGRVADEASAKALAARAARLRARAVSN